MESWGFTLDSERIKTLNINEHIKYNENNSPWTVRYFITYSTSEDFTTYHTLSPILYARYIVGRGYTDFWEEDKVEKVVKDIQKYVRNFWVQDNILLGFPVAIERK